jgi:hypothetical protein
MDRLEGLDPGFRATVERIVSELEKITGRKWLVTSGYRSIAEQDKLYAQGRTAKGPVVTNARGGSSAHNWRLAVDIWPLQSDGSVDWKAQKPVFKPLAELARAAGLTPGYDFKTLSDCSHIEDPDWRSVRADWAKKKLLEKGSGIG